MVGVFGATLNYDSEWFGSWKSPALMVAVSVGLILLGMVLSLYARVWAARLNRPAPDASHRRPLRPARSRRPSRRPQADSPPTSRRRRAAERRI